MRIRDAWQQGLTGFDKLLQTIYKDHYRSALPSMKWVYKRGTLVIILELVLFAGTSVYVGDGGLALDIATGTESPFDAHVAWLAVPLAVVSWLLVPAIVGVTVVAMIDSWTTIYITEAPSRRENVAKGAYDRVQRTVEEEAKAREAAKAVEESEDLDATRPKGERIVVCGTRIPNLEQFQELPPKEIAVAFTTEMRRFLKDEADQRWIQMVESYHDSKQTMPQACAEAEYFYITLLLAVGDPKDDSSGMTLLRGVEPAASPDRIRFTRGFSGPPMESSISGERFVPPPEKNAGVDALDKRVE